MTFDLQSRYTVCSRYVQFDFLGKAKLDVKGPTVIAGMVLSSIFPSA